MINPNQMANVSAFAGPIMAQRAQQQGVNPLAAMMLAQPGMMGGMGYGAGVNPLALALMAGGEPGQPAVVDQGDPRRGMFATGANTAEEWDWNPYLVGGAASRGYGMDNVDPEFLANLQRMLAEAPEDIRNNLRITSAFRSPELQAILYRNAINKYGSEAAARRWVAPPGRSRHNSGRAIDFRYLSPAAREYVHANAQRYGMHFPMSWEPWHIEPLGSRG